MAASWNFDLIERITATGGGDAIDFLLLAGIHTLLNQTAHTSGCLEMCLARGVGVVVRMLCKPSRLNLCRGSPLIEKFWSVADGRPSKQWHFDGHGREPRLCWGDVHV